MVPLNSLAAFEPAYCDRVNLVASAYNKSCALASVLVDGNGDIPWQKVSKQIAASAGAHVSDLPAHIAFVKKYGGAPSLSHINETLSFFNLRLPAGRKVSGNWIQALTSIPITADFSCPRVVQAIFNLHACCDADECDALVSRAVDIAALKRVGTVLKDEAREADRVLGRLKKVRNESERSFTLEYGEASVRIAEVLVGKNKEATIKDRAYVGINL